MKNHIICCWDCGKEYPGSIYPPHEQVDKTVLCECGGQVISRSGKVMLKINIEDNSSE